MAAPRRIQRLPKRPACLLAALLVLVALGGMDTAAAQGGPTLYLPLAARHAPPAYPVNRVGVGVVSSYGNLADYPLDRLPFGWYSDWTYRVEPARPGGVAHVQLLPVGTSYPPNWEHVEAAVRANPGAVWIIGNEPECPIIGGDGKPMQGNLTPEEYAAIYRDYQERLHGWDPTARLAIGGVVQPSPARFLWLERALEAYEDAYGVPMPIDVWTVHNMILTEAVGQNWGAGVPRGLTSADLASLATRYPWWPIPERLHQGGMRYDPCDITRLDFFRKQVEAFRRWMAEQGFRDHELWITEYGVLYPATYDADGGPQIGQMFWSIWYHDCQDTPTTPAEAAIMGEARIKAFMTGTLDYLATARHASYGLPGDGNRLVQRWLWYSLNDRPYDVETGLGFNGSLCDWQTHELTAYGLHWEAYFD